MFNYCGKTKGQLRKGNGVASLAGEHPLLAKKIERTNCFPSEAERHRCWLMSSFKCWCFSQLLLADRERKADILGTRAFLGKLAGCQKMITLSANKRSLCPWVASQKWGGGAISWVSNKCAWIMR